MARFRVLETDYAWPDVEVERAVLAEYDAELVVAPDGKEATLVELAATVDAIMTCWAPVTARVIDAVPDCRIIARLGIGLDNIDVAHATRRGILVTRVPDYCLVEVAEHTIALVLALARKIHVFLADTRAGRYERSAGIPIERLEDQTLGVIGLGQIGRLVAERARALGLRVVATSRSPGDESDVEMLPLDELLAVSDFVSLHCPLSDETRHVIDAAALGRMKPTAFLINTSRGGLVDHQALATALAENRLAGAALDVQGSEPPDLSQPPYSDPRVIVTPHVAFYSTKSADELRRRTARQVGERLAGRTPENVVNPQTLA